MKILIIDRVHLSLKNELAKLGLTCFEDFDSNYSQIKDMIGKYDGLIIRSRINIDINFLKRCKNLKFIARYGAGLENIDLIEAKKRKIQIISSGEGNKQAVAEHCIGMILTLFNKINTANFQIKNKIWDRKSNIGIEISGKTFGILGYGNTGSAFAKCLSGFDCKILVYDKFKSNFSNKYVIECELDEIYKQADIISLHIPYNSSNHYFFNDIFLDNMNKPFYIINSSRGKVVNMNTINKGIISKKILGACLDVLEFEDNSFYEKNTSKFKYMDKLFERNNIIFTPHIAGITHESYKKLSNVLIKKIKKIVTKI